MSDGEDAEVEEDGGMDLEDLIERKDISSNLDKLCETYDNTLNFFYFHNMISFK